MPVVDNEYYHTLEEVRKELNHFLDVLNTVDRDNVLNCLDNFRFTAKHPKGGYAVMEWEHGIYHSEPIGENSAFQLGNTKVTLEFYATDEREKFEPIEENDPHMSVCAADMEYGPAE